MKSFPLLNKYHVHRCLCISFFFSFSQVPPTFLNPEPEVLDLTPGDEITLNCSATGNPVPVYSWQSTHPIQGGMEDEAVITSSSLLPGTYICTASNTLEKKIKKFTVRPKNKGRMQFCECRWVCCLYIVCPNHCCGLLSLRCLKQKVLRWDWMTTLDKQGGFIQSIFSCCNIPHENDKIFMTQYLWGSYRWSHKNVFDECHLNCQYFNYSVR